MIIHKAWTEYYVYEVGNFDKGGGSDAYGVYERFHPKSYKANYTRK